MSVRLTLEDVRVRLGGSEILHGISLDVAPGEFVTLLGPSGSGKTTTLNVVAGLVDVTSGSVLFDGEPIEDRPPHDRDIGLVFQSYALFPHMSVGDNVAFALMARRVPKRERRAVAERMLELVRLGGTADRPVRSLSGGQQQRVALARALASSPSVLLLDEPMAALDKQLREAMQLEIKRIQAEVGVTTVAVTHDQTEAMTMSDRVAIMRDGTIEQLADPETLYRKPATLFAARFLGEANLVPVRSGRLAGFDARVASRDGTAVVRPEDFALVENAPVDAPRLTVRVMAAAYQGTRYRLEVEHPVLGRMIVTLPAWAEASSIAAGSTAELALRNVDAIHVIPEMEESPASAASGAVSAAA